jgi:DNA polymerase III delta subunit
MKLVVISGSTDALVYEEATAQRAILFKGLSGSQIESCDLGEDPSALGAILGSSSLFSSSRTALVRGLNADALTLLEASTSSSATILGFWRTKLTPKATSRIEAIGTLVRVVTPTKAPERAAYFAALAKRRGIKVSSANARLVTDATQDDWSRALSILRQLSMAEITSPTPAQLHRLGGTASAQLTPWAFSDAAFSGDVVGALKASANQELVPLAVWTGAETLRICQCAENAWSAADAAKLLSVPPFRAQKYVAIARRLDHATRTKILCAAAALDVAAKTSPEASTLAIADYLAALAPSPAATAH